MRIIPVIDVMGGVVVRGVAGRRSEYRPLCSALTDSTEPVEVAEALVKATAALQVYVADLDAITGASLSKFDTTEFPVPVLLDAGLRTLEQLDAMRNRPNVRLVVGTETWTVPPTAWPEPFSATLSLDYFRGELRRAWLPLSASERGPGGEVSSIVARCASVIVLDIARVGTGQGSGTEGIIRELRLNYPKLELIAGGGVKDRGDIRRLEEAGADAVLVASALHDGSLFRGRQLS